MRTTADHAGDRPGGLGGSRRGAGTQRGHRPDPGTGRSRPGAHRGHRRLRDERARPHPVRPRGAGQWLRGPGSRSPWPGLRAPGRDVVTGHSPRQLDDTDTFVFTTAINSGTRSSSWRERQAGPAPGRRAGRPPVRRGSRHPPQTTPATSRLVVALQACGLDPSFAGKGLAERPGQSASGDTHAA